MAEGDLLVFLLRQAEEWVQPYWLVGERNHSLPLLYVLGTNKQ